MSRQTRPEAAGRGAEDFGVFGPRAAAGGRRAR